MKRLIQTTLAAFLVIGLCSTTFAQTNSANNSISADATVTASITVSSGNSLDFGSITSGSSSSVDITPDNGGTFTVDASSGASVNLDFTLPNQLNGTNDNIPVSFGAGDAAWTDNNTYTSATTWDPSGSNTQDVTMPDGNITVWLGGSLNPDGSELPGSYTNTVTLTAAYN